MTYQLINFIWLFLVLAVAPHLFKVIHAQPASRVLTIDPLHYQQSFTPCYDDEGKAQRCVPDFINAAFNLKVEVTNTCGERQPTRFCVQTNLHKLSRKCTVCDSRIPEFAHPPYYLTDLNDPTRETWWQSETMADGLQYPKRVNLTLRLGKSFDITYVRLKFVSPRPESFAIYKKTRAGDEWMPWQYYSGSCPSTFKVPDRETILPTNEAIAQCTSEFSDISPLTGGSIAFSTLENRPSNTNFEENEVLQDWVTATEVRISLVRMNTFGDEIFQDQNVLRTYWYAISELAIGGQCKCNGHARECVRSTGPGESRLVCQCQHHTTGVDCQECQPFYVDRPWSVATSNEANECKPCNCNQLARRCFFDEKLYIETGHGGHCIDCEGNTTGPHCAECLPGHWRRPDESHCTPCQCNETGSSKLQCNASGDGQCACKAGVTGRRCDRCMEGFYDFGPNGCRECQCLAIGSRNNSVACCPSTGTCLCKPNVEGRRCDRCKPGYFHLSADNSFGCTPCFCFGHSSVCSSAEGQFFVREISSDFDKDHDGWSGSLAGTRSELVEHVEIEDKGKHAILVKQPSSKVVYFIAPDKYLGDQRFAYNQDLRFGLMITQPRGAAWSSKDLVIVGGNGRILSLPITAQQNPMPKNETWEYRFRIHADPAYGWNPALREIDFIGVLSNVTSIRIRGTYSRGDSGFLTHFSLGSAAELAEIPSTARLTPADWVERCVCTSGFSGQFCERCAPGHRRAQPFGGPLAKCVPCECNGHAATCDPESGTCECEHNTEGDRCERCSRGWYGNALDGTPNDCQKCECPENGPCALVGLSGETPELTCTDCPEGYTGRKCEYCADEYYGDPSKGVSCLRCECSGNIDPNAIGNCEPVEGRCLKCIYNTEGWNCDRCATGYWGDALADVKGECRACDCHPLGTNRPSLSHATTAAMTPFATSSRRQSPLLECRQSDGQCDCRANVGGRRCDACLPGFFNLSSAAGCQFCDCHPDGTIDGTTCNPISGQCVCKRGVVGQRCDQCAPRHYGFGRSDDDDDFLENGNYILPVGCKECICDPRGSEFEDVNCDIRNGQCLCKDYVEGRRCDKCTENYYGLGTGTTGGCRPCDDCYTLIQHRRDTINASMFALAQQLDEFRSTPITLNDTTFAAEVAATVARLTQLQAVVVEEMSRDDSDSNLKGFSERFYAMREQIGSAAKMLTEKWKNLEVDAASFGKIGAKLELLNKEREKIEKSLQRTFNLLDGKANDELEKTEKTLRKSGTVHSDRLSEIAEETQRLAQKHADKTAEVGVMAKKVGALATEALAEANRAVFGAKNETSAELVDLEKRAKETFKLLNATLDHSRERMQDAVSVHHKAALILGQVRTPLKFEEIDEIVVKSKAAKSEAIDLSKKVSESARENAQIIQKAEAEIVESQEKVALAKDQLKTTEKLVESLEDAEKRAQKALALANRVHLEAVETLRVLENFNPDAQLAGEEDLLSIWGENPLIEANLKATDSMLQRVQKKIGSFEKTTNKALKFALDAKERADQIAKPLDDAVAKLDSLRIEVDATSERMIELEQQIEHTESDVDRQIVELEESRKKVGQALRDSVAVEQLAKTTMATAISEEKLGDELLARLKSIMPMKDADFDEIERAVTRLEADFEQSDMERSIHEEKIKIRVSETHKMNLKAELKKMELELGNLKDIRDSLPGKCFNIVQLEQNGN